MNFRNYIDEAKQAIEFRDKVHCASQDEQIAVGTDHINWIIKIVERLAKETTTQTVKHDDAKLESLLKQNAELTSALEAEHDARVKAERIAEVKGNPYRHAPDRPMKYTDALRHINAPVEPHPLLATQQSETKQ